MNSNFWFHSYVIPFSICLYILSLLLFMFLQIRTPLWLRAEPNPYVIFFISSSIDGSLGWFHFLTTVTNTAIDVEVQASFWDTSSFLLNICPALGLFTWRMCSLLAFLQLCSHCEVSFSSVFWRFWISVSSGLSYHYYCSGHNMSLFLTFLDTLY